MLSIEMLPARHGDSLWIVYGEGRDTQRILVDGGPGFSYEKGLRARIAGLKKSERKLELAVTTHIDADHIEGMIRLLGEPGLGVTYGDFWYNAWKQVSNGMMEPFGAKQGEYLSALLRANEIPWNQAFAPAAGGVRVAAPTDALAPVVLPGGAKLTLLSPSREKLVKLRDAWQKELDEAGIEPDQPEEALARLKKDKKFGAHVAFGAGPPDPAALSKKAFSEDATAPNGSSIGLLLEAGGKRVLLLGDAHPGVVEANIDRLLKKTGKSRLEVDAVKLPHHGSSGNVSPSLVAKIAAEHWLFSSDGTFFDHPDPESVARVITGAPERPRLVFNYRTPRTAIWDSAALRKKHKYKSAYPAEGAAGFVLKL